MRKAPVAMFSLILLLASCAGPAALESSTALPAASSAKSTAAPTAVKQEAAPAEPAATEETALPPTRCAELPLGQAMIGNLWNPATRRHELRPLNPETGQALCGYEPFLTRGGFIHTYSPDRSRLALVELGELTKDPGQVQVIQIDAWEATTATLAADIWVSRMAFDPTGTRLALFQVHDRTLYGAEVPTYTLNVLDTDSLETVVQGEVEIDARLLAWSEDGAELLVFGGVPPKTSAQATALGKIPTAQVAVFDPATLERRWEQALPNVRAGFSNHQQEDSGLYLFERWEPGVALSADRQWLYIVHADEDQLTTVDLTSREVTSVPIQKESARQWDWSWLLGSVAQAKVANGTEKFALLTPDGQRLLITGATDRTEQDENGDWQYERISLGLKVVDPATGAELESLDTEAAPGFMSGGVQTALDAPGSSLYLLSYLPDGTELAEIVDLEQMKVVKRLEGESLATAHRLDGSPILLSVRYTEREVRIRVFDPNTWEPLHSWHLLNPSIQGFPLLY